MSPVEIFVALIKLAKPTEASKTSSFWKLSIVPKEKKDEKMISPRGTSQKPPLSKEVRYNANSKKIPCPIFYFELC